MAFVPLPLCSFLSLIGPGPRLKLIDLPGILVFPVTS